MVKLRLLKAELKATRSNLKSLHIDALPESLASTLRPSKENQKDTGKINDSITGAFFGESGHWFTSLIVNTCSSNKSLWITWNLRSCLPKPLGCSNPYMKRLLLILHLNSRFSGWNDTTSNRPIWSWPLLKPSLIIFRKVLLTVMLCCGLASYLVLDLLRLLVTLKRR